MDPVDFARDVRDAFLSTVECPLLSLLLELADQVARVHCAERAQ
jgi:hypothetical protein